MLTYQTVLSKTHLDVNVSASTQGVPGPGQYDIRRQFEPQDCRGPLLSQAEVRESAARSTCSQQGLQTWDGMVTLSLICPSVVTDL